MAAARVTADFVRLEQLEFDTVDATSGAQDQQSPVHREFAAQQLELEETRERLEDAEVRLSLLDAQGRVQESSIEEPSVQSLAEMRAAGERHAGLLVELRASTSQKLELRGELRDQVRQQVELRAELRQAIGDRTGFQLESTEIEDDDHETCELRAELLEASGRSESSRGRLDGAVRCALGRGRRRSRCRNRFTEAWVYASHTRKTRGRPQTSFLKRSQPDWFAASEVLSFLGFSMSGAC